MLRDCRIAAGFRIVPAAEALNIGERTLNGYEANDDAPPDIIDRAADLYQAPIIRYWYIAKHPIGGKILPEVEIKEFPTAVLRLKNSARGIESECVRLAEIADDAIIDDEELEPTCKIMERLELMMHRIIETIVSIKTQIKTTPAAKQNVV